MILAIISDSHDHWSNMEKAINIANDRGCKHLLHAGDLIAPPGIAILEKFNGLVKFVWGNNEAERMGMTRMMDASEKIELCGDIMELELDGKKIFMNHYPRITELAAASGEYDLCTHGHTHLYRQDTIGKTLLINPGEIQGHRTNQPSFIILHSKTNSVEKIEI